MKLKTIPSIDSKKNCYELYVDGEYVFSVGEEDYIRLQLYDKNEITEEELEEIKLQVDVSHGISSGIAYTIRQRRTSKQVEDYLLKNEYSPKAVEKVMQYLSKEKYVDDQDYLKRYIRSRIKTSDKSLNLILAELDQRGIPEEMTLDFAAPYVDIEFDRAYAVVLKRFGPSKWAIESTQSEDSNEDPLKLGNVSFEEKLKLKNKIIRFLIYRGYRQDIISKVINKTGL